MATFTVSVNRNYHDSFFSTRAGGDTYNIDTGAVLTLDCDTRYGPNTTTTTGSAATITIAAASGGKFLIDSSAVKQIAYTGGSGNVPAYDTAITQAGQTGSGKLIGVYSAINAAPTTPGSAMPASGIIKLRQVTGTYTSGALTGITATASGAAVQSWIEVSFDEAGTLTIPRLGEWEMRGGLFELGSTSGSRNQTLTLPTAGGTTFWIPGVWIEDGSGGYDYWPALNALSGGGWNNTNQGTDERSRYVQCYAGGIRIGSDGTNNIGELPASGRKVYIGSNILMNNTTAARGAAAVPNATIGSRFETAVTGGGVLDLQYASGEWYLNLAQSFSIDMSFVSMFDTWTISECASAVNLTSCGNGIYGNAGAGFDAAQFTMANCYAGGTIQKCAFGRAGTIASGDNATTITSCIGQDFIKHRFCQMMLRTNATLGFGCVVTTSDSLYFEDCKVTSAFNLITVTNSEWKNTIYYDREYGTTGTSYPTYCFSLSAGCMNVKVDGLSFGGITNVHPYSGLFYMTGFSQKIKVRNIGTYATPLSMGSANAAGYLLVGATGGAIQDIEFKRCYISNTRSGLYSLDLKGGFLSKNPDARDAYFSWDFGLPKPLSVDAGNDEQADRENLKMGTTTKSLIAQKQGRHWQEVGRQRKLEILSQVNDAVEIESASGGKVSFERAMDLLEQRSANPAQIQAKPAVGKVTKP